MYCMSSEQGAEHNRLDREARKYSEADKCIDGSEWDFNWISSLIR